MGAHLKLTPFPDTSWFCIGGVGGFAVEGFGELGSRFTATVPCAGASDVCGLAEEANLYTWLHPSWANRTPGNIVYGLIEV